MSIIFLCFLFVFTRIILNNDADGGENAIIRLEYANPNILTTDEGFLKTLEKVLAYVINI